MIPSYKIDEKILKNIIKNNTLCTNNNETLELVAFYKSKQTSQLIMTNGGLSTHLPERRLSAS